MYREARNRETQVQILAELNSTDRIEIIRILLKNGEKLPARVINKLYSRLDTLEKQIFEKEREYCGIVRALRGGS